MQPPQQQPPAYHQGPPQPQTIIVQQRPVVTVHQGAVTARSGAVRQGGSWKGMRITGYMQTVLGVLAVMFGIVTIILKNYLHTAGTPIWSGICFFVVAGILGIAAGGKKSTGLVVGYMVMSILSSLAAFSVVFVVIVAAVNERWWCPDWYYGNSYYYSYECSTSFGARTGIDACIAVIGVAEFVISIVGASFTCCGLCNNNSTPQATVTYQHYPQQIGIGAPPQNVYYPPGTTVAHPNQVVMQPGQAYQPQGHFQPPPQGQYQPPPQGQLQPPPQGQFQPQPQQQAPPVAPEAPSIPSKEEGNFYQPLTKC